MSDEKLLRELLIENPDLEMLCFVGEEAWTDNFPWEQADVHGVRIDELTLYEDKQHNSWYVDKDDLEDKLRNLLEDSDLSDEEFGEKIKIELSKYKFTKYIVFYVG